MAQRKPLAGAFLTFEGIDGCGKTTQSERLVKALQARGVPVHATREPGGTEIGMALRRILLDPAHGDMEPHTELLLYLADRIQHLATDIQPARQRGETVICDRFHDATVAYQQYGRGLDFGPLERFIAQSITPLMPVTTFWLDVTLETARARMDQRAGGGQTQQLSQESRLDDENAAFHDRVRKGYLALHREAPERIVRIDAEQTPDQIAREIWTQLEKRHEL